MNIHPLFVHFPIALLSVYAVLEIFRLPLLIRQAWYQPVKIFLLLVGTGAAFVTLQTGEMAEHLVGRSDLIELHSTFASASTYIFGILALAYLLKLWASHPKAPKVIGEVNRFTAWIVNTPVAILLALVGVLGLTITGALGGAIVYGPDVDPVVKTVYDFFF